MMGWECPKCGRVYAPFMDHCPPCSKPEGITASTVPNYACTCGSTARCPLHAATMLPTTFCLDVTGTTGCKATTERRQG